MKNRNTRSSNPTSGYMPIELKVGSQRRIFTSMFIAALFMIAKRWKQPKCSKDRWMDKANVVCAYNEILYSLKKEENLTICNNTGRGGGGMLDFQMLGMPSTAHLGWPHLAMWYIGKQECWEKRINGSRSGHSEQTRPFKMAVDREGRDWIGSGLGTVLQSVHRSVAPPWSQLWDLPLPATLLVGIWGSFLQFPQIL